MTFPKGFHITFGTYMSRPPGSARPHIDKDHNQYGEPFAPTDSEKEKWARENARESPVELTLEQRKCVQAAIIDLAKRYAWIIYALCANFDHVHVAIGAPREGTQLRDALKAVASKWLNKQFGKRTWWTEGGSAKYLWEPEYFENAVDYVTRQRTFLILS